ncbi:hypothetical protein ABEB36_002598 [Hypothenemus hampei]
MKYWDTKHLTLKLCHSVDTQTSNFTFYCIPLPRLKSLHIEECCDYIIKFLISMCPNLEELKVKTRLFSTLTCQRLELNTTHRCLEYTPSQIPWSISIRATDTIKSIKYLSLTYSPMAQYYTQLMELCVNISKLDLVCFSYWNPTKLLNFDKLVTLNLIYCNLDENLEQVLSQCSNLKYLTIVPFYKYELFDALHSNSIILKCAHRLGHSLKRFIWGFSADYLEEAGKLYAGFPQRGFNPPGRTNIDRIPIILNVSQPNFQQIPFVEIELLENYLRQQNWTASVRILDNSEGSELPKLFTLLPNGLATNEGEGCYKYKVETEKIDR